MSKLKIGGDATGAVKAVADIGKAAKEAEKSLKGVTKEGEKVAKSQRQIAAEARKAAREEERLAKAANRIVESISPLDKYNRKMRELKQHVDAGRIAEDKARLAAKRYKDELNSVGNVGKTSFASIAKGAAASLAGMVSLGAGISLIRGEYEKIKELEEKRSQANLTAAESEQQLRFNLAGFSKKGRKRVLDAGERISSERGIPLSGVHRALSATASSTGDQELTVQNVDLAFQTTRNVEDAIQLAAGIGNIQAATNDRSGKKAIGAIAVAAQESNIIKIGDAATQLSRLASLYTAETTGSDLATAVGSLAAITKGAADSEGRISRTALVTFVKKGKDFFNRPEVRERFSEEQTDTHNERLAILRGDKGIAKEFLSKTSLESGTSGAISKFLLGDEVLVRAYNRGYNRVKDEEKLTAAADDLTAFTNAGPLQATAKVSAAIRTSTEGFRLRPGASLSVQDREDLIELVAAATNSTNIGARLDALLIGGLTLDNKETSTFVNQALDKGENPGMFGINEDQEKAVTVLRDIRDVLEQQAPPPSGRQE